MSYSPAPSLHRWGYTASPVRPLKIVEDDNVPCDAPLPEAGLVAFACGVLVEATKDNALAYAALYRMADVMAETPDCTVPPPGWQCSREPGHDGPCAARPEPVLGWQE